MNNTDLVIQALTDLNTVLKDISAALHELIAARKPTVDYTDIYHSGTIVEWKGTISDASFDFYKMLADQTYTLNIDGKSYSDMKIKLVEDDYVEFETLRE